MSAAILSSLLHPRPSSLAWLPARPTSNPKTHACVCRSAILKKSGYPTSFYRNCKLFLHHNVLSLPQARDEVQGGQMREIEDIKNL